MNIIKKGERLNLLKRIYVDGGTLEMMAREVDITRERCRQLLKECLLTEVDIENHFNNLVIERYYPLHRKTGRNSKSYRHWRKRILDRDNNTCMECDSISNLCAHHIKSWLKHPKERYLLRNGITLCFICHKKTHNYGGRAIKSVD